MKQITSLLLSIFSLVHLSAQDTVYFKEALLVSSPANYGREAITTDELAYRLYSNTLTRPAEAALFGNNEDGDTLKWVRVKEDSIHRLRPDFRRGRGNWRRFRGNYIYLTYDSPKEQDAVLHLQGNSHVFFNGELHTGDPYNAGWLYLPVHLKKGLNEIYARAGFQTIAKLILKPSPVSIITEDATLPFIVLGHHNSQLKGAVVIMNTSGQTLEGLTVKSVLGGAEVTSPVPAIPAMATRKIPFIFNGSNITLTGKPECQLTLLKKNKTVATASVSIETVEPTDHYSETFTSDIDGSVQYYSVTPQTPSPKDGQALFLSVHGAGVEAIGQARAYQSKDWGTLVAATNRRPRGFNWEDWGRIDALEVLSIAKNKFKPDPKKIYLTGHSMGGHGTWFLGATYPGKWAAIGPCSGYPTLQGYGSADGAIPDSSRSNMEQILLRASHQSNTIALAHNYAPLGVYILHGDSDRVVPVKYARQMRQVLAEFHPDFAYYEYPGGEHWFGNQSVDWKPLFEFLKRHEIKDDSLVNEIDFSTSSPGISSKYHWVEIVQQLHPLNYSRIQLSRKKETGTISGSTQNVSLLKICLDDFSAGKTIKINLDSASLSYKTQSDHDTLYVKKDGNWMLGKTPIASEKNPNRYGTLKEAFNHRMIFVYGTTGSKEENQWNLGKARYDAETWYYRGNGAVDIIADKDYSTAKFQGRNVIIYGNSNSNSAWKTLLADCPIRVTRGAVSAGDKNFTGDDLATYFVWPMKNTVVNSVGVIAATGTGGMQAANVNQYFAGASGFPDFMIFTLDMLKDGEKGVKMAGYFDNQWRLTESEQVEN